MKLATQSLHDTTRSDRSLVTDGHDRLRDVVGRRDGVGLTREDGHAAEKGTLCARIVSWDAGEEGCSGGRRTTGLLRLDVRQVVGLNTVEELLTALRVLDVLQTDVHALLDVAVAHDLIHDNADSVWCDVVDNAGATERFSKSW
jgi:hypothetical protein